MPRKVDTLELFETKQESGLIDFSPIKNVKHFRIEKAELGKNVEIRFPQQVEKITFDDTCKSIPKRLNLNIKGLKEVDIKPKVQPYVEEIILLQGVDVELSSVLDSKIKITYANPEEGEVTLQEKPNFWKKLFSKTR